MKLWQIKNCYPKADQYEPSTQATLLLKELKGKAGVYCWYNISTDLFYIGSSNNLGRRMSSYLSLAYLTSRKGSSIICSALLKYGFASFSLLILETLESGKKEQLLGLEQRALDTCKPAYNILPKAGSSLGFNHSSETKALLSSLKKGSSLSEVIKAKLSELNKGSGNPFFGKKHTLEALAKMSDIKKGELNPMFGRKGTTSPRYVTGKKIYVYSSDELELISIYRSLRGAEAAMQSDLRTLKAYAKSRKVFRLKFILSFEPLHSN